MVLLTRRAAKVCVPGPDTVTAVSKGAMVTTESPLTVTDRSQGSAVVVRLQRGVLCCVVTDPHYCTLKTHTDAVDLLFMTSST